MPNQTKPYYPTRSVKEYEKEHRNNPVILELNEKSLGLSASKWGREHLIACRVIQRRGRGKILPILKAYAPKPNDLKYQAEWNNIQPLIDGPSKDDLRNKSRRELEREHPHLGTVWSALAKCLASRELDEPKQYPKWGGPRTQVETPPRIEPHFPDGREVDEGKSSQGSSYRPGSSNGSELDEDKHDDRIKCETITVNLAGAFIRYVLNFCAVQDPAAKRMVEFREEQIRVIQEQGLLKIDATDDGGIWSVETREQGKSPWKWGKRLALLEAKRAFQRIDDDNRAVVPDANWAQYTCEALTSYLEYPDQKDVFVIAMTQTHIRFLHFNLTEDYIQYLRCDDVKKQKDSNAYLHMTETGPFALDSNEGRRNAVCNLLGLVKFWEEQLMLKAKVVEKTEGSGEELERDDNDIDSGDLKGSEKRDSKVGINDSNNEDSNPRLRKKAKR